MNSSMSCFDRVLGAGCGGVAGADCEVMAVSWQRGTGLPGAGQPEACGRRRLGAESRRPLGLAVVVGLLFSQTLTLYVTPVFYLYMEKLQQGFRRA